MFSHGKGYFRETMQEKVFFVELIANIFLKIKDNYKKNFLFIDENSSEEDEFNKLLFELSPEIKFDKKNKDKKSFIFNSFFEDSLNPYNQPTDNKNNEHTAMTYQILETLDLLDIDGMATFLLPPIYASHAECSENLRLKLKEKGFFINHTIMLPDEVLLRISAKTPIIISVTRKEEEDEFFGLYDSNLITERRNEIINFHSLIMEGIELPGQKRFASQFETASYKEKLTMMSDSLSLEEKKEAIDDIELFHNDYSNPHNPKAFKNNFIDSPYIFSSWKNFPGFYRLKAKTKIEIISKETDFDKFKKLHLSSLVKNIDTISFNSLFRNLDEYVSAYETSIEEDNWKDIDEQEKKYFDQEGQEDYITEDQYKAISGDYNIVSLMAMGYPYAQIRMNPPTVYDFSPHIDISEWIIANENGYLSQEFKLPTVYKVFDPHNDNTEHSVRMVNFQDSIAFSGNCPIVYGEDPWGSSVMSDIILESPETFQIEVNKNKLLPEYLEFFLNTELGQEYLKFAIAEERHGPEIIGFRREITISELKNMEIPVPTLEEQKKIIESNKRISQVFDTLNETKKNLTYNSISNDKYLNILEDLASAINKLSEEDQIKRLIKGGESVTLEFKEGYIYDFKKSKEKGKTIENKSLKPRILKNIGSFLNNQDGGILLIGVHDDLSITGMDNEIKELYKSSYDSFQNSFKDYIIGNLGIPAWNNLEAKFIEVDGKNIYKVECRFSEDTVYIKEHGVEKLPARLGPSSELLEGKKMVEYLKTSNKNNL